MRGDSHVPNPALLIRIAVLPALAAAAAAVLLLGRLWPWRSSARGRSVAEAPAVGGAFFLGAWVLGVRPHWPPAQDLDRFLLVLLPAVVVAETAAVFLRGWAWWAAWPPRLLAAAGAG